MPCGKNSPLLPYGKNSPLDYYLAEKIVYYLMSKRLFSASAALVHEVKYSKQAIISQRPLRCLLEDTSWQSVT
jgi:hypothetical protein